MKLLLDTHVLIWALTDDKKLPKRIADMIDNGENDMLKLLLLPFYLILLLFKLFWGLISAFVRLMGKLMWFCCGAFLVIVGLAWLL